MSVSLRNVTSGEDCAGAEFTSSGRPSNGTTEIVRNGQSISYTPDAGFTGEETFSATVSNERGQFLGSIQITVTVTNDAPNASDDRYSVDEKDRISRTILSNDGDPDGHSLTAQLSGGGPSKGTLPDGLGRNGAFTFETNGAFTALGEGDRESVSFDYTVEDGFGGSDRATVTITVNGVNDPPTADPATAQTDEDTPLSVDLSSRISDVDDSDETLNVEVSEAPSEGTASTPGQQLLRYAPTGELDDLSPGEQRTVSVRYRADDGNSTSGEATVSVEVSGRNDAPSASRTTASTKEDQSVTIDVSGAVADPDDDASALSAAVDGAPSNGTTSDENPDDLRITYAPDADFNGTDQFTYRVEDDGGASATGIVEVAVSSLPDVILTGGKDLNLPSNSDLNTEVFGTPVGVLRYAADEPGALIEGLTVTNSTPGVSGIEEVRLYSSNDDVLSEEDPSIGVVDTDPTDAPSTVSFDNFRVQVDTGSRYLFVTLVLADDAPAETVRFTIEQPSGVRLGNQGTLDRDQSSSFPLALWEGPVTLPVELAQFAAKGTEEGIRLTWKTASETNNAGFQVQRHVLDGGPSAATGPDDWTTVGRREGAGTTDRPQSYQFTDADLPYAADSVRYRLRQIDTDGQAHLSDPVTVARGAVETVQLKATYPNPASEQITVRYAVPESTEGPVRVALYDVLGRRVRTLTSAPPDGRSTQSVDLSGLSSGTYVLRLRADGTAQTRRLTVVR